MEGAELGAADSCCLEGVFVGVVVSRGRGVCGGKEIGGNG